LAGRPPNGDDRHAMTERRARRSQNPVEALAIFVESQRAKLCSRGLAVTTRDGRLLAGSGQSPERLARAAIEIHEAPEQAGTTMTAIATWWMRAGRTEVLVASRGGRLSHELGSGVRRILTS
jgi:hypothetical protein